jgi:hypothetical protein
MESATEAVVIQSQLVDVNPIQIDHDGGAEDVIMEYSVPTKVSLKFYCPCLLQKPILSNIRIG